MNFSLKNFVMDGLRGAIGRMPDYKLRLSAVGWHEKGVLSEGDLAEINTLIEEKNAPKEMPSV
jgi:hypothetical protein